MNISTQNTDINEFSGPDRKNASDIVTTDIRFDAPDGFPLAGTLFGTAQMPGQGPLVLISSATGAPRGFYAAFARQLVAHGCRAVLTYDYRGLPESPRPASFNGRINMRDWAHQDMPAAIQRLDREAPGHQMVGVGQSFGGQALGLCGMADRFERYAMVACQSGHWRHADTPWQNLLRMHVVGLPLTSALGETKRWMGLGEPFPASVFRDFARWCFHPDYFFGDPAVNAKQGYATVAMPILCIGMTDDPWGTPRAVHALMEHYVNASIEERWLSPQDAGGQPIGHLGFFKSRFADTLWPDVTEWIVKGSLKR